MTDSILGNVFKQPVTVQPRGSGAGKFVADLFDGAPTDLFVNVAAIDDAGFTGECYLLDDTVSARVDAFVAQHTGKNIYYGVNPLKSVPKAGKATKAHVVDDIRFVQVDLDPPKGIPDVVAWKATIEAQLKSDPATAIVDSGGGLQLIWRLTKPVGQRDAEKLNRHLCQRYGGDRAATDCSRLMRLPFTTNYPNAKKIEAGRVPAPAKLKWFKPKMFDPTSLGPDWIDELPVTDPIKFTIRTGQRHPDDDKQPYESDSEARYAVIAALLRARVSRERIGEIVTASPVIGTKKRSAGWLDGEIDRVVTDVVEKVEPHVQDFINLGWAQALVGNQFRLIRNEHNVAMKRDILRVVGKGSFRDIHADRYHMAGRARVDHVKEFLESPAVPRFMDIVVNPRTTGNYHNEHGEDVYNLWKGYSVPRKKGNGYAVKLVKQHLLNVIADGDYELFEYLWRWFCFAIQFPAEQTKVALVLQGEPGTGKGVIVRVFGRLLGQHFMQMMNSDALTAQFNAEQLDVLLLFCDEAFWVGDKKAKNKLKGLVTEPTRDITYKGIDTLVVPNMLKLVFASNEEWVTPADRKERRYCVTEVSSCRRNDENYFAPLFALADGHDSVGLSDLLDAMLEEDLATFNPRDYPMTAALREQQEHSMDPVMAWFLQCLRRGRFHDWVTMDTWTVCPADWRWKSFARYCRDSGVRYLPSPGSFGIRLSKLLPPVTGNTRKTFAETSKMLPPMYDDGSIGADDRLIKTNCFVIAPLVECRAYFCEVMGRGWTLKDVGGPVEESVGDP